MCRRQSGSFLLACGLTCLGILHVPIARGQSFQGIGDLPDGPFLSAAWGVSADGHTVVGSGFDPDGQKAIRWTATTGAQVLGPGDLAGGAVSGTARAASTDGSVAAGIGTIDLGGSDESEPFRWTSDTNAMTGLGDLPGGGTESLGYGVSGDGRIVVGKGVSAAGTEAFRWVGGVMTGLGDLPGGVVNSRAFGISNNGAVIVGVGTSAAGSEAFRWTSGGGMVGLGDLPGGTASSFARAADADGSVVVGEGISASGPEAFRWESGGMIGLGDLPGGQFHSAALAVSGDGAVVVGDSEVAIGQDRAFLWTAATDMLDLKQYLIDIGLAAQVNGWTLTSATGISADGLTIVGRGINPSAEGEGWVVVLPEPSAAAPLVAFTAACCMRRRRPRRKFSEAAPAGIVQVRAFSCLR